jgi:hypothetical protein
VQQLDTLGSIVLIAIDAGIPIAPKSTADHKMLHKSKATAVLVGAIEHINTNINNLFTPLLGASIKMDWQRANSLGEYANTRPDSRYGKRDLLGYDWACSVRRNGVREEGVIDSRLKFGRGHTRLPSESRAKTSE